MEKTMIPANLAPSPTRIEARVAFVPYEPVNFRAEPPSAASWRFLKDHCNVRGVRLQYLYDDPRWWPGAIQAAHDGGMEVHGNFCIQDMSKVSPSEIQAGAGKWIATYAHLMKSVSFSNEIGYAVGFDGIPNFVENLWLPFYIGVRQSYPAMPVYGVDSESVETQATFEACLLKSLPRKKLSEILGGRGIHNYGDQTDPGVLDYATMAGENGKPGFASLSTEIPTLITEIDHQQWEAAIDRGEFRGIATDDEIDRLTAFCIRMRDEFKLPVVTLNMGGEYFCTRVPVTPWIVPQHTWSTWTHGPEPVLSEVGKRLAAVFAAPIVSHPVAKPQQQGRRKAVR